MLDVIGIMSDPPVVDIRVETVMFPVEELVIGYKDVDPIKDIVSPYIVLLKYIKYIQMI